MSKHFYVYIHLDPRVKSSFIYGKLKFNYEPFYVGKGYGKRAYKRGRNKFYNIIVSKLIKLRLEPIIKVFPCFSEQNAFEVEKTLIRMIGRRDQKLGPLTNLTDGGEGSSGLLQLPEINLKRKNTMLNKTSKQKAKMYEKRRITIANRTPEQDKKIRENYGSITLNRTKEQKEYIKRKIKRTWSLQSKEYRREINNKHKRFYASLSPEEYKLIIQKRAEGIKKAHQNHTPIQ